MLVALLAECPHLLATVQGGCINVPVSPLSNTEELRPGTVSGVLKWIRTVTRKSFLYSVCAVVPGMLGRGEPVLVLFSSVHSGLLRFPGKLIANANIKGNNCIDF